MEDETILDTCGTGGDGTNTFNVSTATAFVAAGADRIVSVDLHTGQIQGYIDGPFDSLTALPVMTSYLESQIVLIRPKP